jgi:hypothetical protein
MSKKHKATPKLDVGKHITRRRLARWEQERRRRRIYSTLGILVIALVVLIVVLAYTTTTEPVGIWVTTVGDTDFYGDDYADALHLCQLGFYATTGNDSEDTLMILETSEIMRQGAVEAGIGTTGDEIQDQIRFMFETENQSLSDKEFEEAYQQLLSDAVISDAEFREVVRVGILQAKLEQYVLAQIPNSTEHVHVEALLLDSEEEALGVKERINSGENFSDIAEDDEYSDIGWLPRGVMNPEVDEVAFSLEVGEISDPIYVNDPTTQFEAYYILLVSGKQEMVIAEDIKAQLETSAFPTWIEGQRETKVERNPDLDLDELYEWALEQIAERGA